MIDEELGNIRAASNKTRKKPDACKESRKQMYTANARGEAIHCCLVMRIVYA